MSVLVLVSNGDIQRSNMICSQDQHAQAQHWLRQAQLMHAQHWPRTQSHSRQGRAAPPLPCSHLGPRPTLSMHELSLPEPMLSLSMLILANMPRNVRNIVRHVRNVPETWERRSWPTQDQTEHTRQLSFSAQRRNSGIVPIVANEVSDWPAGAKGLLSRGEWSGV